MGTGSGMSICNGYLFLGTDANKTYQLNASNVSQQIANFTTLSGVYGAPACAHGYLYIGDLNYVYQLNATNVSQQIANYSTGPVYHGPTVTDDYLLVGGSQLYQLNAYNISNKISNYSYASLGTPVIVNGILYFSGGYSFYQFGTGSPTVVLDSPVNRYGNNDSLVNIQFNCSAFDSTSLSNISLFITNSSNGAFSLNQSTLISGQTNITSWNLDLPLGSYTWNCLAYDSDNNFDWSINRTIYIEQISPTNITLNYPPNNYANNTREPVNVTFNCSSSDNLAISDISLYLSDNNGNNFQFNSSTSFNSGTVGTATWRIALWNGNYTWACRSSDTAGNINMSLNRTLLINFSDMIPPNISIVFPRNNLIYGVVITALNYTSRDNGNLDSCWYSIDGGITNSSAVRAGTNFTGLNSIEGWNNWTVYCNDSFNNIGGNYSSFFIDLTPPVFNNLTNQTALLKISKDLEKDCGRLP